MINLSLNILRLVKYLWLNTECVNPKEESTLAGQKNHLPPLVILQNECDTLQ